MRGICIFFSNYWGNTVIAHHRRGANANRWPNSCFSRINRQLGLELLCLNHTKEGNASQPPPRRPPHTPLTNRFWRIKGRDQKYERTVDSEVPWLQTLTVKIAGKSPPRRGSMGLNRTIAVRCAAGISVALPRQSKFDAVPDRSHGESVVYER